MRLSSQRSRVRYPYSAPPFFFQAEDGIRDPLWSRGLGDVYKRQGVGVPRTSSRLRCDRLLLLLCFRSCSYYVRSTVQESEKKATRCPRALPQQHSNLGFHKETGSRREAAASGLPGTSPGLWLGIAWHKRQPCPREVGPKHRLVWLQ